MSRARDIADGKFTNDLTVDTDTLVVDAANDRVGMGTTSPYGVSNFMNLTLKGKNASSGGLIRSETSDASITSRIYTDSNGLTLECDTDDNVLFRTNGSERGRWLSGGGLTFNGDTAAANALDDYEEGVWTPTVTPSGSGSISITGTSAKYTKIGNQVTVWLKFQVASTSSPSGRIGVSGAPFSATGQPYAAVAHVNGFSSFTGKAGALVESSGTFNIDRYINGGISSNLADYAANNAYVFMTATYPVS